MVGLIQEIWEKQEDTVFHESIEKICQTQGLQYFSNPRHPFKRGGGTAIVVDTSKIFFEKLNIVIPHNLEIIWGLLRPKQASFYKVIIVASFYLPPKSKKKSKLFDHVSETLHIAPRLKQIVTLPTRGKNILSVIITNMSTMYSVPVIHPAV